MKIDRREFLHLAAGAITLPAVSRIARAQTYPSRPVRMIVPFAAGGPTDTFARLIAQLLSERLGKQFYVENITGAGGNTGIGQGSPILIVEVTFYRIVNLEREVYKSVSLRSQRKCLVQFGVHRSF